MANPTLDEIERLDSSSEEETEALGARLAPLLANARRLLLDGDLGAGKTVLVRGLAHGLGIDPGEVASPSFALLNEYGLDESGRPRLRHLDLYRIETPEAIAETGLLELLDDETVPIVIEWPREWVGGEALVVRIEKTGESTRRIAVAAPGGSAFAAICTGAR